MSRKKAEKQENARVKIVETGKKKLTHIATSMKKWKKTQIKDRYIKKQVR